MPRRRRHWRRWLAGLGGLVIVVAFGGPLLYNTVIAKPPPALLTLPGGQENSRQLAQSLAHGSLNGLWSVGAESLAGFRVPTEALGYRETVVGRTHDLRGSLTIAGNWVHTATFSLAVTSVLTTSNEQSIFDVKRFPQVSFVLNQPVQLTNTSGQQYAINGTLTLNGVARSLAVTASVELVDHKIYLLTDIPITFAGWHITVPFGVKPAGTLEVLLSLVAQSAAPV